MVWVVLYFFFETCAINVMMPEKSNGSARLLNVR